MTLTPTDLSASRCTSKLIKPTLYFYYAFQSHSYTSSPFSVSESTKTVLCLLQS